MSRSRYLRAFFLLVCFVIFVPQSLLAVPANKDALKTMLQPYGASFEARLYGDEWAHWYETVEGFTILKDKNGYWHYAERDGDGRLKVSGIIVGRGIPWMEKHLRPSSNILKESHQSRRISRRDIITRAGITGIDSVVVILIEFTDTPAGEGSTGPHTAAYFSDPSTGLIFGNAQGTLRDYFDEVSYGQLDLQGTVANSTWHLSTRTELYYGQDCTPGVCPPENSDNCNVCIYELAREAIQLADAGGFDFSPYDADGDSVVDHVLIIHAGQDQAASGGVADDIWSHSWSIPGGEAVDGVRVENYTMLSEHDAMNVFAHEYAHDLGAPDLYDYDMDSEPVGEWCNMASNVESNQPPHICGLLKIDLDADFNNGKTGWATPVLLAADSSYTVSRLDQNSSNSVFMTDPAFSSAEYFLVENRQQSGYYDYSVPEAGIIFTHIDMDMPDGSGRFNDGPPGNSYHGAWIERPGDVASPDSAAYSADDNEDRLDPVTIPNTNGNDDIGTGIEFKNIGPEGDTMTFEFRTGPTYISGTIVENTTWRKEDSPFLVNGSLTVSADVTLTIEPGVIVKFSTVSMTVDGTLIANGTVTDSIVFTSYRDDAYGGDTNQDGPSNGASGDWYYIAFNSSGVDSMSYCRVRYAGRAYSCSYGNCAYRAINLAGAGGLVLSHSVIEYTKSGTGSPYAIYTAAGTSLDLSECIIANNEGRGISASSDLTLFKCNISNNGEHGVYATGLVTADSCLFNGNGSRGLYVTGSSGTITNNSFENNGDDGLYCSGLTSDFHGNTSDGNTGFGYTLHAEMVSDIWRLNSIGTNGHLGAIGVLSGSIDTSTTWDDTHTYVIFGAITVTDGTDLTLEKGSILKFGSNAYMKVHGLLNAVGAEADSIVFTNYYDDQYGGDTDGIVPNPSPTYWYYLWFEDSSVGCSMRYCIVRYAGRTYSCGSYCTTSRAIYLYGTGTELTLTNSVVENMGGLYYSICGYGSSTNIEISESIIRNNAYGIYSSGTLLMHNCEVLNNADHGVYATGTFTLEGCTIRNNEARGAYLTGNGGVITGNTFENNTTDGLYCSGLTSEFYGNSSLDNTGFGYTVHPEMVPDVWHLNTSGINGHRGAIGVTTGSIDTSTTWIDSVSTWDERQVYAVFGTVTVSDGTDLTIEPGTIIKFDGGNMTVNGLLHAVGTETDSIIFTSYKDDDFGGDTNDDPAAPARNNWGSITFNNSSVGCMMRYCRIRYGAYIKTEGTGTELTVSNCLVEEMGYSSCAFYGLSGTILEISESEIRQNSGCGINTSGELNISDTRIAECGGGGIAAGGVVTVDSCLIESNVGTGVYVSSNTATISGCTVRNNVQNGTGNNGYGFYIHPDLAGQVSRENLLENNAWGNSIALMSNTITQDDTWPNTYTFVAVGNLTIADGATLLLLKGTVLKFYSTYYLQVNGGLVAQGDAVEKVVFTSFKDDAYGGDTNDDGIDTTPAPGNWSRIYFYDSDPTSQLVWVIVSYAGASNYPAIEVYNSDLDFESCIIINNQDRGVRVHSNAQLDLTHSDIYNNGYGFENLNTGVTMDATNCFWGDPLGPYHPTQNPNGGGNQVSDYVLFEPYAINSIDNPWVPLTSPSTTGNYTDVLAINLVEDDFMDIVASTEESGIEVYSRTGFETWQTEPSPITAGEYLALDRADFNKDNHDDLLVCGPTGIRCFIGDGAGGLTEVTAPLVGQECSDAHFCEFNHDGNVDIVGCAGNNAGVWVFYGDGAGGWNPGNQPIATNSYNRVAVGQLNNDSHLDIVATNAEYHGIHYWYGAADSSWTQGTTILDGYAFFALDVDDIDGNGFDDIAVGANQTGIGIQIHFNDGAGGWTPKAGPTASGIYNDLILADLNGDTRLDMAAASQGGGIGVWIGTSNLFWNYWYHPVTDYIYNGICVDTLTPDPSLDLAGASTIHGLALWKNLTPGVFQEYFAMTPDHIDFGPIALGKCAYEDFQLENVSPDTVNNVFIYSTNPVFEVSFSGLGGGPGIGPFDMLPGEIRDIRVSYYPVDSVIEREAVIIHSTKAVTHVSIAGEGVPYIMPVWSIDVSVANAIGDSANSQDLTFGAGVGATDGFDPEAGEVCLPPYPVSEVFDARFYIDEPGCEGSVDNIHDLYAERDSFVLKWQVGAGGYPVTVSWDPNSFPDGTFLISDVMGGVYVDSLNMADTNEVVVVDTFITELSITTFRKSTFNYDLSDNWHLLSLAVTSEEDTLPVLFPGAVSAFTWSSGGYVRAYELASEIGYWINMGLDTTVSQLGEQIRTVRRNLDADWHLVGTVFDTVSAGNIQEDPPGAVRSIFGYDAGYYMVTGSDVLLPGRGYWFDISEACEITISMGSGGGGAQSNMPVVAGLYERENVDGTDEKDGSLWWRLPVTIENGPDNQRNSKQLVFGIDETASEGIDLHLGEREVPPWPPTRVFDARLSLKNRNGLNMDLRDPNSKRHVYTITWQAGERGYPVILKWDSDEIPETMDLTLRDNLNGTYIHSINMKEVSSLKIDEDKKFITSLVVEADVEKLGPGPVTQFALMQNYPNPFNPSTTIRFDLPKRIHVILRIYDVSGRVVKTLINRGIPEGRRSAVWDGTSDSGERAASGLYFYRIEAGDWTQSRKLLLLK